MPEQLFTINPIPLLGGRPSPEDARDLRAGAYVKPEREIPPEFYWTKFYGWWPLDPIDQDGEPACTIFSAATAQKHFEQRETNRTVDFKFSELVQEFRKIQVGTGGAYLRDGLKLWQKTGLPGHLAYHQWKGPLGWLVRLWQKRWFRIDYYVRAATMEPDYLKAVLYSYGGIGYACVALTDGFFKTDPFAHVRLTPGEVIKGWHAMACLGYTNAGLILAHTWGTRPPQVFTWEYAQRYCPEFWLVVDRKDEDVPLNVSTQVLAANVKKVKKS